MIIPIAFIGFIAPIAVAYIIILIIADAMKKKRLINEPIEVIKAEKMIDKEDFLKEHDRKIAEHSEAQEPTRMERVSMKVERLSDKKKPMVKVKEIVDGETVVRREEIHTNINVKNMFTCRDDVIKGMIYAEILSEPKGIKSKTR